MVLVFSALLYPACVLAQRQGAGPGAVVGVAYTANVQQVGGRQAWPELVCWLPTALLGMCMCLNVRM